MKHGTLVIVGSGPVGMTSALLLNDRFERIVVLERQSKEKFLRTRGFTFPIVFSPAARNVLRQIGVLEAMNQERSPYFGVVVHKRVLGAELTWTAKRGGIYSHWRNHIVTTLYDCLVAEGIDVARRRSHAISCPEGRLGNRDGYLGDAIPGKSLPVRF